MSDSAFEHNDRMIRRDLLHLGMGLAKDMLSLKENN